jgi:hypothetical protein
MSRAEIDGTNHFKRSVRDAVESVTPDVFPPAWARIEWTCTVYKILTFSYNNNTGKLSKFLFEFVFQLYAIKLSVVN